MNRSFSIRLIAPVLLMLPVLVVSAVILSVTWVSAGRAAERDAYRELAQIRSTARERVDALLQLPARVVQLNQDLLSLGKLDTENPATWRKTLLAQSAAFPSLSAITWGSEKGESTWIARYGPGGEKQYYALRDLQSGDQMSEYSVSASGQVSEQAENIFDYDPRIRPWYTAAVEANRATWSEPYAWAGDEDGEVETIGLSHSAPHINSDGLRVGVISADLNLNDISTFLAGLRIGETGISFIVDQKGGLIACSESIDLTNEEGALLSATDSSDPVIVAATRAFSNKNPTDRDNINTTEGKVFATRASVGSDVGLDWSLITVVPEADFMAEARSTRVKTLSICAVVVLLTMGLGYLISRRLSQPVLKLESHLKSIGEGEFDQKIELSATKEFQRLSKTVNQMSTGLRERTELRRSLALAMEVQQSLLPDQLPQVHGLEIAGTSDYCDQTGGDYYDFLELSDTKDHGLTMVVGDVMGHGIAAAMLMATARGILRSRSCEPGNAGQLMSHLNEQLAEVTQGNRFMTMFIASVNPTTRQIHWASAGHDMPFVFDPNRQDFVELEGGGLPLGVMAEESYEEYVTDKLPIGTIVALTTDGVFEARNKQEEHYGKERIMQIIREHQKATAEEIAAVLKKDLEQFQEGTHQEDDITYVVLKITDPS